MYLVIKNNADEVGQFAANYIANKINQFNPTQSRPFVLGLPTGSTPLKTYQNLIKFYQNKDLSFENVVTFNMDEYVGLSENDEQSYHYFMQENLFKHIDIKKENTHLLNALAKDLEAECASYEEKIKKIGGIRLFLGGVGEDGHIAFNEPFSSLTSRTRVEALTQSTIHANARFFGGDESKVPTKALTVGVGTIMDADEVLILATGKNKAKAIKQAVEGAISHVWTISALQMHPHTMIVCDQEAASELCEDTVDYFCSRL